MEGKELYNEDDELNPKKNEDDDSDNFGLPEIEDADDKQEGLGDPFSETWSDKKEEETQSYSDEYSSSDSSESNYAYSGDTLDSGAHEDTYKSSYYEEEYGQKKSPVGWIIFAVIVVAAVIVGVFWWLNREPEKEVVQPVIEKPIVEKPEPVVEKEPEPEPEPVRQAGVFEINQPTGRYHVIVASSIDKDLVVDYGNRLAKNGLTCNVLAPRGNRKFHRLSVADYVSLNDAAIKAEQLKSEFGDEVWVIRY
jgi:hypothetical protein